MIASVFPLWVQVPVATFAAIGTVASTILTIINLDQAIERLRRGGRKVAAKFRGPS